ncbi:hypothetical protein JEQ12_013116 [Ovis aries]|uniref:Beta/alpha-defensin C-terminal domain-containing protein n=1 Tax=Ovis aries TaxID=9940 RepID=A0A836CQY0_SHEEP|nr:hypothetical protein JEQ12_013116 [Ovis aries]
MRRRTGSSTPSPDERTRAVNPRDPPGPGVIELSFGENTHEDRATKFQTMQPQEQMSIFSLHPNSTLPIPIPTALSSVSEAALMPALSDSGLSPHPGPVKTGLTELSKMVSVQLCSPQSYPQRKGIRLHSDHPFSDSVSVFEDFLGLESKESRLSGVTHANHQDPEGPRKQEESPGRGTNRSHPLHHQIKRYLVPREPPFPGDVPPGIRNIICLMQHGTCRLFFCRSGFTHGVTDSLSCRWKKGICVLTRCPGTMRQIGTCFGPPVKCCRLK